MQKGVRVGRIGPPYCVWRGKAPRRRGISDMASRVQVRSWSVRAVVRANVVLVEQRMTPVLEAWDYFRLAPRC